MGNEGLNAFYQDYRNKRININVAILYVRDEVRGVARPELDTRLDGMRKASLNANYDDAF